MPVVASEISPLNCRWIVWKGSLPFCARPPQQLHVVTEAQCSVCDFWEEPVATAGQDLRRASPQPADPLNREACPRCGSHDVVLMQRDAVVQSFVCSICHQRWLATRPWPLLRETRSHQR
jgi:hypothetical protein